jgi:nucleotide-binding universal stress UspA family protein
LPAGRYLVAIDFSRGSSRALAAARKLARQTGASLTLIHVRPTSDIRAAVVEERGDLLKRQPRSLRGAMDAHYRRKLASLIRGRRGEHFRLLVGSPEAALCKKARQGYDLLVMGSRGHGAVSSLFLGSTAQRTLARSPVPVLVVPVRRR